MYITLHRKGRFSRSVDRIEQLQNSTKKKKKKKQKTTTSTEKNKKRSFQTALNGIVIHSVSLSIDIKILWLFPSALLDFMDATRIDSVDSL